MHSIEHVVCGPAVQHIASAAIGTFMSHQMFREAVLAPHRMCSDKASQYVLLRVLWVGRNSNGKHLFFDLSATCTICVPRHPLLDLTVVI